VNEKIGSIPDCQEDLASPQLNSRGRLVLVVGGGGYLRPADE